MALVAISIAKELPQTASQQCMFASLLGCNLGPNLTIFGSLATMLVMTATASVERTLEPGISSKQGRRDAITTSGMLGCIMGIDKTV